MSCPLKGIQTGQMPDVVQLLFQGQLTRAAFAIGEVDRHLDNSLTTALDHQLKTNLVADRVKLFCRLKGLSAKSEESGHRIGCSCQRIRQQSGEFGIQESQDAPVLIR